MKCTNSRYTQVSSHWAAVLFALLANLSSLSAQDVIIPIEIDPMSNTYYIDAGINGNTISFILDTGASSITLSELHYNDLLRAKKITESDIIGKSSAKLADGSMVPITIINIRKVQLGNRIFNNIEGSIIHNPNVQPLLGQSLLNQFGKVTIDKNNSQLILTPNATPSLAAEIKEIKLIPCSTEDRDQLLYLKSLLTGNQAFKGIKISEETNIPRGKAVSRIKEGSVTVRYFDPDSQKVLGEKRFKDSLNNLIAEFGSSTFGAGIVQENMLPSFNNRVIPDYLEIWIRSNSQ